MTNSDSVLPRDAIVSRYITAGGDPVVGLYNEADVRCALIRISFQYFGNMQYPFT